VVVREEAAAFSAQEIRWIYGNPWQSIGFPPAGWEVPMNSLAQVSISQATRPVTRLGH